MWSGLGTLYLDFFLIRIIVASCLKQTTCNLQHTNACASFGLTNLISLNILCKYTYLMP